MIKSRLKTSKAWTEIPQDFKIQVLDLFKSHFKPQASVGHFELSGRIYKNEVILRFSYLVKGTLKPVQFDLSSDLSPDHQSKALDLFEKLVDCAASLFQSTFDDESFGVPSIWTEIDFENLKIYAKSESINQKLEDEANKLLGADFLAEELDGENLAIDKNLIYGDIESDDIEKIAEVLNPKTNIKKH